MGQVPVRIYFPHRKERLFTSQRRAVILSMTLHRMRVLIDSAGSTPWPDSLSRILTLASTIEAIIGAVWMDSGQDYGEGRAGC